MEQRDSKELKRNPEREEGRTKKQRDEKRYNIWKRSETVGKTLGSPRTITTSAGYATHGSSFLSHGALFLRDFRFYSLCRSRAIPKRGFIVGSFASKWNFQSDELCKLPKSFLFTRYRSLRARVVHTVWFVSSRIEILLFLFYLLVKNRSFHFTNKSIRSYLDLGYIFPFQTNEFRLNCSREYEKIQFIPQCFSKSERNEEKIDLPKHLDKRWRSSASWMNLMNLTNPKRNYYPLLRLSRLISSTGKTNLCESRVEKDHGDRTKRWKWRFLLSARLFFPLLPPPRGRSLPLANPRDGRIWTSWQLLRRLRWNI